MTTDLLKVLRRSELTDAIAVVIGTRPGIVKQGALIREILRRKLRLVVIHTGQHYSYELDAAFFEDLDLPPPHHRIQGVKDCVLHGEQTAQMLRGVEQVLLAERPAVVVVGGDANTNLAAALAARKLNITLCHEEAGLRSDDWLMPEEHNRVMIDHISEHLFAPNEHARQMLEREYVRGRIHVTGSLIVDAVREQLELAQRASDVLKRFDLRPAGYLLMTLHHEESVDYREVLEGIVQGVGRLSAACGLPIVFPAHPRTRIRLAAFGIVVPASVGLIDPVGYFDFLRLLSGAETIMTDSGGVIQEAAILGVPCITLGRATEWIETVEVGANRIVGTEPDGILAGGLAALSAPRAWPAPFGAPGAAGRIVDIIEREILGGTPVAADVPVLSRGEESRP